MLNSKDEMLKFAAEFSKNLSGGTILALKGDLGSGKTTFAKGLGMGLGIRDNITSPTFVIMKQYRTNFKIKNLKLIHVDCYRLKSAQEAVGIGLTDYLGKEDCISIIEWPERINKILPKHTIYIYFEHINENKRKITVDNFQYPISTFQRN